MSRRYRPHHRRRGHRGQSAQAVLEIAMVFPIMVVMIFNFLALMVEVEAQNQLHAAVGLAVESSLTAEVEQPRESCAFSAQAFYSTAYSSTKAAYTSVLDAWCNGNMPVAPPPGAGPSCFLWGYGGSPGHPICGSAGNTGVPVGPPARWPTRIDWFWCGAAPGSVGNFYEGTGYPVPPGATSGPRMRCSAQETFTLGNTPLGFGVFYTPTITATADANASPVRQCNTALPTC